MRDANGTAIRVVISAMEWSFRPSAPGSPPARQQRPRRAGAALSGSRQVPSPKCVCAQGRVAPVCPFQIMDSGGHALACASGAGQPASEAKGHRPVGSQGSVTLVTIPGRSDQTVPAQ